MSEPIIESYDFEASSTVDDLTIEITGRKNGHAFRIAFDPPIVAIRSLVNAGHISLERLALGAQWSDPPTSRSAYRLSRMAGLFRIEWARVCGVDLYRWVDEMGIDAGSPRLTIDEAIDDFEWIEKEEA